MFEDEKHVAKAVLEATIFEDQITGAVLGTIAHGVPAAKTMTTGKVAITTARGMARSGADNWARQRMTS